MGRSTLVQGDGALPSWVGERAAPWAALATEAWRSLQHAEEGPLRRAFAACAPEARRADLEGLAADSLRGRLLVAPEDGDPPFAQLPLLFALAYELSSGAEASVLLDPLRVPSEAFSHQDIHDGLLRVAAARIPDEAAFWPLVFATDLTFVSPRDSDFYFVLGAGLAKSRLFTDQRCLEQLEEHLRAKSEATPIPGQAPTEKRFIQILMIALLRRSPAHHEPVARIAERYASRLREQGQAMWTSLFHQEMKAIFRETGKATP